MPAILVVDDHSDNRIVLSQMLRLNGYAVDTAANGREALRQLARRDYALVLMDLHMPVMDGWNATAAIKADPLLAHIPVLAVTGHVTSDALQRARAAGCVDYLEKPLDYSRIVNTVRAYMPLEDAVVG